MAARTATRSTRKTAARKPPPKTTTPPPRSPAGAESVPSAPQMRDDAAALAADLRDRAADILDGARQGAAEEAARLIRAAEDQAQYIRRAAASDARQVLAEVADEAGTRLRRAEAGAECIRAVAGQDAQTVLVAARADAAGETAQTLAAAGAEAGDLLAKAEQRSMELIADVEARAAELVALRRAAAEAAYRDALDDAARIVGEAQEQATEIRTARAALDSELELTRRSAKLDLDEEAAAHRAEIEAGFRARAEQLRKEAEAAARTAAAGVRQQADEVLRQAEREREAAREARRLAEKETVAVEKKESRKQVIKQVSIWTGLAAVIILTASGEWAFATMVGLGKTPIGDAGWALPVGLDIYAVTAFRMKRDVPYALGLMAATNLTYHAADMTGLGMEVDAKGKEHPSVWLISVAVIVVVAIVWRIHRLLEGDHDTKPDAAVSGARTDGPGDGRTESPGPARTDGRTEAPRTARTEAPRTARTDDARTAPVREARTARTRRTEPRTGKSRTGPGTPARTDAEALAALRALDAEPDGFVNVNAARTALGCNRDRAVRLLSEAGLLRPADAAKHLPR
ncbi:coiled-coil domain-containing protein [Streptomyces uncialis]|uniref:hypothetical protein n=1 Tax=Streptomyces uncialis TaxID=1048205 RepID=UPI002E30A827|nr:hypothetical protein [Streptomyces uncialis]